MRILKIFPLKDNPFRYNYHINYGVWDCIKGDSATLETFNEDLNEYDVIFLPAYSRWKGHDALLNTIKAHGIHKVLFDNDTCYRSFDDPFYEGIDFIFYRCSDKNGDIPANGQHLPWSVNHQRMTPVYGGGGVAFVCSLMGYPMRKEISKYIDCKRVTGVDYIEHIQQSAAAIHVNSEASTVTRAKVLEFAACGTQIISNRTPDMNIYFPDELVTYFEDIDDLLYIVDHFKGDERIQRMLRQIVEDRHTDEIRAKQILSCV